MELDEQPTNTMVLTHLCDGASATDEDVTNSKNHGC